VANINRVVLVGNLTRDPELRTTQGGMSICSLGIAVNHRRKNQSTGEWVEEPNYFDIKVFGSQGENCARFLSKGRAVAIDGRLSWSQWEAQDGSGKRSKVEVIAETVQFIGPRDGAGENGASGGAGSFPRRQEPAPLSSTPTGGDPWAGATAAEDDIPF
jgi:single-strand DNA-binding protein